MALSDRFAPRLVLDQIPLDTLDNEQLTIVALRLYRESCRVVQACGRNHEGRLVDRPRVICCGLLVRIAKFMLCVDTLMSHLDQSADLLMAVNRCMLESSVNVIFLLKHDDPALFEDFVAKSLGPEREFHDFIKANIERTGASTPMEDRMLASIERVFEHTGLRVEDVPVGHRDWGGNMREKMKAIGSDGLYAGYRLWSHAVHGTWADVLMRHVEYEPDGFVPEWLLGESDSRLLNPMARMNLEAAWMYGMKWFDEVDRRALDGRARALWGDLETVSRAAEALRQQEHD